MAGVRFWKICMLILEVLPLSQSSITPRISFYLGSPDRKLSDYHASDAQNSTALLLSPDGATLFVGARNAVLSLDVSQPDVITLKNKFYWEPQDTSRCGTLDKKLQNCANFIHILQFVNSTHLYACGSFAFAPHDIILTVDTLSVSRNGHNAKGRCPYKETQRNTAVIVDGELYTATQEDISGQVQVVSRHLISNQLDKKRKNLQLKGFPALSDPTFVSSSYIPSEGKVLFFFREAGAEYNFMEQFTVSRVAQVCTDDNGGERVLQKGFTTFAKSQLVCQMEKQLPFSLLQDIIMVPQGDGESPDNTLFYGIFTSKWALVSGQTAVCAFTLQEIKAAFSGDYKTYNSESNQWKQQSNPGTKLGKCGFHNNSDNALTLVKKTFLTLSNVHSLGKKLLLTITEQLYSRITAQRVQAANGQNYTVLYLLTETGFLHKVVLLKNESHIIEEIQVFKQPQTVKTILLSVTKNVVFVGLSEGVIRVPVSNCTFYSSCADCVLARDPFCGWDSQGKVCAQVSDMRPSLHQDVENGNAGEQCADQENGTLVPEVMPVHLYQLVRLPCRSRSRLAQVNWFSNHGIINQSIYQQEGDGTLVFHFTPKTPQEFRCVTEEQGFQQTVATFSLTVRASPRSWVHRFEDTDFDQLDGVTQQKSYYNEMVAVSILFAMCLCVLAVGAVSWWRKSHNKSCHESLPFEDLSRGEPFVITKA